MSLSLTRAPLFLLDSRLNQVKPGTEAHAHSSNTDYTVADSCSAGGTISVSGSEIGSTLRSQAGENFHVQGQWLKEWERERESARARAGERS